MQGTVHSPKRPEGHVRKPEGNVGLLLGKETRVTQPSHLDSLSGGSERARFLRVRPQREWKRKTNKPGLG